MNCERNPVSCEVRNVFISSLLVGTDNRSNMRTTASLAIAIREYMSYSIVKTFCQMQNYFGISDLVSK